MKFVALGMLASLPLFPAVAATSAQVEFSTGEILSIIAAVAAAAAGAIGTLWRQNVKSQEAQATAIIAAEARTQVQLKESENKRDKQNEKLLELSEKVGGLRGADEMAKSVSDSINQLQKTMLEEIKRNSE